MEYVQHRMTPGERMAWSYHLRDYPPGDFLTQRLLATVCAIVSSIGSGKSVTPDLFAPWLKWTAPEPSGPSLEASAVVQIAKRMAEGEE